MEIDNMYQEITVENFFISTDPKKLDIDLIYNFLSLQSYWAKNIPRNIVEKSLLFSLCFGIYELTTQSTIKHMVGFGRVITDYATYAYICDVFIIQDYRGKGLGKFLIQTIKSHPELQNLRRWSLVTKDAHGLYRQYGFKELANPENYMEIKVQNAYLKNPNNLS